MSRKKHVVTKQVINLIDTHSKLGYSKKYIYKNILNINFRTFNKYYDDIFKAGREIYKLLNNIYKKYTY